MRARVPGPACFMDAAQRIGGQLRPPVYRRVSTSGRPGVNHRQGGQRAGLLLRRRRRAERLGVLGEWVGDGEPGRLGTHVDVGSGLVVGIVVEASHRNAREPVRLVEKRQRGAALAAEYVGEALRIGWLERPQMLPAARVSEGLDLEEEVGSECCSPRLPASRAMAIVRPDRILRQLVANGSAEATSRKRHDRSLPAQRMGARLRQPVAHRVSTGGRLRVNPDRETGGKRADHPPHAGGGGCTTSTTPATASYPASAAIVGSSHATMRVGLVIAV